MTVNVGYNRYTSEAGQLYYNPDVQTLLCVAPGNNIDYRRDAVTGLLKPIDERIPCPRSFAPPPRTRLLQKLTFTFSIGSDF